MRTWIYARMKLNCGSCRAEIAKGAVMLEIEVSGTKRARCEACGRRMFEEAPPQAIVDGVPVPQPSLPMAAPPPASHDFVTVGQAGRARKVREIVAQASADYRRRQSGDDA